MKSIHPNSLIFIGLLLMDLTTGCATTDFRYSMCQLLSNKPEIT